MSKRGTTIGNNLKDIGKAKQVIGLSRFKLPKLGESVLGKLQDAIALRVGLEEVLPEAQERIRSIGEVLSGADQDTYLLVLDQIKKEEKGLVEWANSMPTAEAKRRVADAVIRTAAETYPASRVGLERLASLGHGMGVLIPTSDKSALWLPLSNGEGYQWQNMTGEGLERPTLEAIRRLAEKAKKLYMKEKAKDEEERKTALAKLYEGIDKNLIEVIEEDGGEAVVFAPDRREKGKIYTGGHIKVHVTDGVVYPLEAVGGCGQIVARIAEAGIGIPVNSLGQERLKLQEHLGEEKFRLALSAHSLLNRGYAMVKKEEKRRLLKEKADADLTGLLTEGQVGTAFFFRKIWKDRENEKVYRWLAALIERNDQGQFRVAETLPEFEEYFASCREFTAPGEFYSSLPEPLATLLRSTHIGIQRKSREFEGSDEEENGTSD